MFYCTYLQYYYSGNISLIFFENHIVKQTIPRLKEILLFYRLTMDEIKTIGKTIITLEINFRPFRTVLNIEIIGEPFSVHSSMFRWN